MRIQRPAVMLAVLLAGGASLVWSQTPSGRKISSFAPAEDLLGQVDYYIGDIEKQLADPKDYDIAKQSRVWKHANTLAVLAMVLANHDQAFPEKPSMAALLAGAQELAADEETGAEKAQQALATIKAARAGQAGSDEAVKWGKVAAVPALMKQVPLVHAGLRRGVAPNRLAKLAKESAAQAAALAAIAEASLLDDQYGQSPEQKAQWSAFCSEMRDAAAAVNSAIHAQDQDQVDGGMKRLLESCDACHAKFRQQ
jgi:cytochrome c556